jgi:hypothetical protein
MPRKRTPDQETTETSTTVTETPPTAETTEPSPGFADKVERKKWVTSPDPYEIAVDTVAEVRLYESRQDRQMAIKFEKKPSQPVIDKMHEEGWIWKPADRIWARPVWADSAMSTRIEAERLYQDVCKMIRQEKGIKTSKEVPF